MKPKIICHHPGVYVSKGGKTIGKIKGTQRAGCRVVWRFHHMHSRKTGKPFDSQWACVQSDL